ncbi:secreted RxLR effector protein 161-like [Aristolochia californica]|uniref:secreted RxLR effector protein 161-like n=1 Tax=Aristolochia californica TaxID=171875 RepID=UPI0035DE0A6D
MGKAVYVIGIKIDRDKSQGTLGKSQEAYINKILERYRINNCSSGVAPIVKGNKLSLEQGPKNNLEREEMKNILYASAVGSLMYAQVCTRPDIAYAMGMLVRYQSNPDLDYWKAAKKVMRYLQRLKDSKLMYGLSNHLEVIGYLDSDFASCLDSKKSTLRYVFILPGGDISWRSGKQSLISTSITEAEFVACFEESSQAIWSRSFILGLKNC